MWSLILANWCSTAICPFSSATWIYLPATSAAGTSKVKLTMVVSRALRPGFRRMRRWRPFWAISIRHGAAAAPCLLLQPPLLQGKIERWHQTLKNRILLENYYLPGDLEAQINAFVAYYNHRRYHESIDNLTPADVNITQYGRLAGHGRMNAALSWEPRPSD